MFTVEELKALNFVGSMQTSQRIQDDWFTSAAAAGHARHGWSHPTDTS
jgi:hypothetical protein